MLEAARWAPSSSNEQPWAYLIATRDQTEEFQRMVSCLLEGNVVWAQHAAVLMLAVASLSFARNSKPNRHAFHDVGLASENLVLQATALGVVVHQMAGFLPEKAREVFEIPEGNEPLTMIAAGYPGRTDDLPETLRSRETAPRSRKTLSSMVFTGKWGNVATAITEATFKPANPSPG
jgi:nitroreductase